MVLSHAHLDHSGYIPALVRDGFAGNVITTEGTAELCSLLLPDGAHFLEEEAERAASDRLRFRISSELGWNARVPHDGEEVPI